MSLSTSYVAEGTVEVDGAAMGIGEVDQGILDLGTGGMFPAPDTGDTVFMDPDPDGGVMDRIGDPGGLIILHIPIMELMVIPIPATDT
jgi:hypothetical protein